MFAAIRNSALPVAALAVLAACQRATPPEGVPQAHAAATMSAAPVPAAPPIAAPSIAAPSVAPSAAVASALPPPSFAPALQPPRAAAPARPALSDAALAQRFVGTVWRVEQFGQIIDDRIELKQGGDISGYPEGQGAHWAVTNGALVFVRGGALVARFDRNLVSAAGEQIAGGVPGDLELVLTLTRLDRGAAVQDFADSICDARLPPAGQIRVKAHGPKPGFVDYRMPGDAFPRPRYAALRNGMMMQLSLREASGVNAAEGTGVDVLYDDGGVAQVEPGRSMSPGARTARAELCPAS
ncbi:MAG: hypothetical protein AB7M12_09980 [Hyphomonadaceae bacterium]